LNSPFDERKYKRLLKGLEVSEVRLSDVLKDNEPKRIDSEYFRKKYLIEDRNRNKFQNLLLGDFSFITDGQHGYHEVDENSNIKHLTAKNAKYFFANDTDADRIAKWVDDNNKRSSLEVNDLILSTRGTVGACAIVGQEILPANIDQDVARIKLTKNIMKPTFIATYINSKIGQDWIIRNQTGMVQQGIALWRVRQMPIPNFTDIFQAKIDKVIRNSEQKKQQSQSIYRQAEKLLLETIGLSNFKTSTKATNIKSFKESFLRTGRLDAEYYQPKYEEIIAKVKRQSYSLLGNLVTIKKSIEPGSDVYSNEGLPFIRVSDYNKFGISTPEKCLSNAFCRENAPLLQSLYPKKETILFSKDGSVSMAFMVRKNIQAVTSGAILHLIVKNEAEVLPEYLTLVLNSYVVKQQAERDVGGSIILHWRINEIEKVVIPIVPMKIQQQIVGFIEESFSLRGKSEELLEEAKEMVEREIGG
jgi:restriction endonuclease S subunit